MERWLNRVWYENGAGGFVLRPLSWLFAAIVALRRAAWRRGWFHATRLDAWVIVVGNLTVGGTGKTPFVVWLVERLRERGVVCGVVSRGHGGSARQPMLVELDSPATVVGDEALLVRRRTGRPVAVGRDRVAAASLLVARGVRCIVADDGLQHYRLARDREIALVDGARGFGNARSLPAGPMREPASRLGEVSAVVVNASEGRAAVPTVARVAAVKLVATRVEPAGAIGRDRGGASLESWRGRRVHAVAGIGNPQRFFALLRSAGLEPTEHAFPDHHAFRADDLRFEPVLPVLMTEKDAVKCAAFDLPDMWYVPVDVQMDARQADDLLARLVPVQSAHVARISE